MTDLLLRRATVMSPSSSPTGEAGGTLVDVAVRDGVVTAVGPDLTTGHPPSDDATAPEVVDLGGRLLIGSFVEPHLHLDKVFTAPAAPVGPGTAAGSLGGAMSSYQDLLQRPLDEVIRAAKYALRLLVRNGVTLARIHVGCGRLAGIRFVEAMVAVREWAAGVIDLQIVAHVGGPALRRPWSDQAAILRDAIAAGADAVGGNPSMEADPDAALDTCLQVAVDAGVPVDLHLDETTDASVFMLRRLAERDSAPVPVTASHCVSLGRQSGPVIADTAGLLARQDISVVVLPATNLYLQGRGTAWRGLPPVDRLLAAGVEVAAGGDNVQDPFNPTGRFDPLDTRQLLVLAAQLDPAQATELVSAAGRRILGAPLAGPVVGAVADLVALDIPEYGDPLALAGARRRVWRAGVQVADTTTAAVDLLGNADDA